MRCDRCGLAFALPRPTPEALTEFYQATYFNRADTELRLGYVDYDGASWAAANASRAWDELGDWAPATRRVPRTLLDVGAATGDFGARASQDGWAVTACELGDTARAKAGAKGLATIPTLDDATGQFGLITMFHVLEHVIDPFQVLTKARQLVDDPDGLLAIELPSWNSAGRILRRSKWAQLRPPEHINFFSRSSLRRLLERTRWEAMYATTPYPRAGELAREAARNREGRRAVREVGRLTLGAIGLGGYLRVVAAPV